MWSRALVLPLLCGLTACGGSRSEETAETPEPVAETPGPVAETERVATDTLVTTRTMVDTTIVTIDTAVVVDTTYTVDTTMVEGGRGEIVDTTEWDKNIIIGHLIPAGSGIYRYAEIDIEPQLTAAGLLADEE